MKPWFYTNDSTVAACSDGPWLSTSVPISSNNWIQDLLKSNGNARYHATLEVLHVRQPPEAAKMKEGGNRTHMLVFVHGSLYHTLRGNFWIRDQTIWEEDISGSYSMSRQQIEARKCTTNAFNGLIFNLLHIELVMLAMLKYQLARYYSRLSPSLLRVIRSA